MTPSIYNFSLIMGIFVCSCGSLALIAQCIAHRYETTYQRATLLSSIAMIGFVVGFYFHLKFDLRESAPSTASALSLTYFHIAAVCFSWSHTGLLRPSYPTRSIVVRDLLLLVIAISLYWAAPGALAFLIFFLHTGWLAFTLYRNYFRVRNHLWLVTKDRSMRRRIRFMATSCHLIIFFGIGSIAISALAHFHVTLLGVSFDSHTPFAILLFLALGVFTYITVTLIRYGDVSEHVFDAVEQLEDRSQEENPKP